MCVNLPGTSLIVYDYIILDFLFIYIQRNLTTEEIQQKVNERKETLKLANISAETDSDDEDVPLSVALQHKKLIQFQQQQQLKILEQKKEAEKKQRAIESCKENNEDTNVRDTQKGNEDETNVVPLHDSPSDDPLSALDSMPCFIPYNLITQHSIPDKSIADCVEALIGMY